MIKRLFLIGFLITFLLSSLSLFLPVLYLRYEIKNFITRYLTEALVQSDSEARKNILSFVNGVNPELEVFDLSISRTNGMEITLDYQQKACLGFLPGNVCLFPVRSKITAK